MRTIDILSLKRTCTDYKKGEKEEKFFPFTIPPLVIPAQAGMTKKRPPVSPGGIASSLRSSQ